MSDEEILEGIAVIARAQLGHEGPVTRELVLVEGLGLDSIRLMALVVELETRFGVTSEARDDDGLETVGDLVDAIQRGRS